MTKLIIIAAAVIGLAQPAGAQEGSPPATGLPQAPSPARPPQEDAPGAAIFVDQVASANLFGMQLAQIALSHAHAQRIRDLAGKMARQDNKAQQELKAAARQQSVRFQPNLSAAQAQKLDALKTAPDDQFDSVFLSARMTTAQDMMSLLSLYASKGMAGPLKHYAMAQFQNVRMDFLQAQEMSGR